MSLKPLTFGLAAIFAATLLILVYARARSTLAVFSPNETSASSVSHNRVEAELLVLRADGFKPNEITRPAGRFLLVLQNHSGDEEISLVLKQEAGPTSRQIRLPKRQSKLKEFIHLSPGRYELVEANHPEWTCRIIIAP